MKPGRRVLLNYSATVTVRSARGLGRQKHVEYQGAVPSGGITTLDLKFPALRPGLYRISANATISAGPAGLTASLEGGVFQVY